MPPACWSQPSLTHNGRRGCAYPFPRMKKSPSPLRFTPNYLGVIRALVHAQLATPPSIRSKRSKCASAPQSSHSGCSAKSLAGVFEQTSLTPNYAARPILNTHPARNRDPGPRASIEMWRGADSHQWCARKNCCLELVNAGLRTAYDESGSTRRGDDRCDPRSWSQSGTAAHFMGLDNGH